MDVMEKLLASQDKKLTSLSRNQQVEGDVVAILDKEIVLDIGAKSEGVLPKRDLEESQLKNLKIGDKIKTYVSLVENEHGQTVLSAFSQAKQPGPSFKGKGINWQKFLQAKNQKSKFSGKVLEINKGGLMVDVDSSRGFLPNSQVGFELLSKASKGMEDQPAGLAGLVGQTINVEVLEIDQNNNKLIFSQRGGVSEEVRNKLSEFKKDEKVKGKIVAILPFGLVVDINGAEGLVFISDVSWEKVEDLSKLYKAGDEIEVLITGLDEDLGRLNLSIKHLIEDPFSKLAEKYPADEVVKGEVLAVFEAGVSIKLDGVEGFLPASKMDPDTAYELGKVLSFLVDSVDTNRRRVNLAPFVTSTAGLIYK